MTTNSLFTTHIRRLRRLIFTKGLKRVLFTILAFSLILNTIALGIQKIGLFQWEGYAVYPLLVLLSVAISLLLGFRNKIGFMDELIEIDARLGLNERLSTAYEYHQSGRKSLFVDLLVMEANNLFGSMRSGQIFPRRFSTVHLLIPLFSILLIILLSIDLMPGAPEQMGAEGEKLRQTASKMLRHAQRERRHVPKTEKKNQIPHYEQMEKMAKALQEGTMTRKRFLRSLDEILSRVEGERARLARRLEAELSLGDGAGTPTLRTLRKNKPTQKELDQLKKHLKELFDGKVPTSLSRRVARLEQNQRLAQFLQETMDETGSAIQEDPGSTRSGKEKTVLAGKAMEEDNQSGDGSPGKSVTPLQPIPKPEGNTAPDPNNSEDQGPPRDEDLISIAGRGKTKGKKNPPSELESTKRPPIRDKGISGEGDRYNIHVRSLPTIGKARAQEEDVFRAYERELETVLKKEDIPMSYRAFIKNYFLSIGLRKEEDEHTNTQ